MSLIMATRQARLNTIFEDIAAAAQFLHENKPSGNPKGYHKNKFGELVHSSGKKENKKFANNTTFKPSPYDALLHTDGSKEGARASLPKDDFVFHGSKDELEKDPRKKWFPVSSKLGWASAAGSLRQAYERAGKEGRQKVMSKVRQTTFIGAEGKPIEPGTIDPIGKLKGERPECVSDKHPIHDHIRHLRSQGKHGEANKHANRVYRLCKDHGPGGGNEYQTKFTPSHEKYKSKHAPVNPPWHSIKLSRAGQRAVEGKFKQQVGSMVGRAAASGKRFTKAIKAGRKKG